MPSLKDTSPKKVEVPKEVITKKVEKVSTEPVVILAENPSNTTFIPIDNDILPTKGVFYEGKTLMGRTLKVIELKKLSNVGEHDAVKTVNSIMSKVITGVDWNQIKVADKQALIFWVRCNTFRDPRFTISYSCNLENGVDDAGEPKICGADNKLSFSLDDLEYDYIDESKLQDDGSVYMKLPFSGDEIVWEYPSNREVDLIEENFKKLKQIAKIEKLDEPDYALVSYSCIIKSINGVSNLNVAYKYSYFSEELSPADYMAIESVMEEEYSCGVKQNIKTVCKECGGQVEVPVMFSEQFFNPAFTK